MINVYNIMDTLKYVSKIYITGLPIKYYRKLLKWNNSQEIITKLIYNKSTYLIKSEICSNKYNGKQPISTFLITS